MSDWFETLDGLHDKLWQCLGRGVADGKSPARRPTFATVGTDGWPEARTVVLRHADREAALVEVHTDIHSDKIASLRHNPRGALHVWQQNLRLQIRLQADVEIRTGKEVAAIWADVPNPSRQSYGITPAPGTPIPQALDYVKDPDQATFAVLTCHIQKIDLVHLGDDHRRATYARASGWAGQWLAP